MQRVCTSLAVGVVRRSLTPSPACARSAQHFLKRHAATPTGGEAPAGGVTCPVCKGSDAYKDEASVRATWLRARSLARSPHHSQLAIHIGRRHADDAAKLKNVTCSVCSNVYPTVAELRLHIEKRHGNESVTLAVGADVAGHECNVCGESYASAADLGMHRERRGHLPA